MSAGSTFGWAHVEATMNENPQIAQIGAGCAQILIRGYPR